jgi:hypothetical protein
MTKSLMEAAADILKASKANAPGDPMVTVNDPLNRKVVDLDKDVTKAADGTPTAKPPGQSSTEKMPMDKIKNAPPHEQGRSDLIDNSDKDDVPLELIRNRGKNTKDTVTPGKGNVYQEGDTTEDDEEVMETVIDTKALMDDVLESCKVDIDEDIKAIFAGQEIDEDFTKKAAMIFEAAINSRLTKAAELMQPTLQKLMDSKIEELKEKLEEDINEYLGYIAEQWAEDNKLAIESGVRTDIAESFMSGLKTLFEEHYIDIPEDKVDVVTELTDELDELKENLNQQISKNLSIIKELNESKKQRIIKESVDGLTLPKKEKITSLAENIEFTTEQEFKEKVDVLKENYSDTQNIKVPNKDSLNSDMIVEDTNAKVVDPMMQEILRTISRTAKR